MDGAFEESATRQQLGMSKHMSTHISKRQTFEESATRQQLCEDATDRPDVDLCRVVCILQNLLWRPAPNRYSNMSHRRSN